MLQNPPMAAGLAGLASDSISKECFRHAAFLAAKWVNGFSLVVKSR